MSLNEADTRAKLIDPAIHARGWTEDLIRREETAGAVEIIEGRPRRRSRGRTDYTLRVQVNLDTQPIALALIEAKAVFADPEVQRRADPKMQRSQPPFRYAQGCS
jgi:type I restriction enzyme R subunit